MSLSIVRMRDNDSPLIEDDDFDLGSAIENESNNFSAPKYSKPFADEVDSREECKASKPNPGKKRVSILDYSQSGEEFPTGLFDCMSRPALCCVSGCCPCISELRVGWAFGAKFLGVFTFFVTLFVLFIGFVYVYFENALSQEYEREKLAQRYDVYLDEGDEGRVGELKLWAMLTYLMLFALLLVRLVLYYLMRWHVRRTLKHVLKKNPAFFDSPDCCAVCWCAPCVLCQHAIAAAQLEDVEVINAYQRMP